MTWSDIGNGVAKVAPWVGSLLGGKAGEAVGNLVAEVLGTDPTPDAVQAELVKNPEAFLKIREMETNQAIELARLQSEDLKANLAFRANETTAEIDDRKDARARDRDFISRGLKNDRANLMIVADVVGLVVCLVVLVTVHDLPGEVRGIIGVIAGYFGIGLRDAHQFEFGSSRGSREKDMIIAASEPVKTTHIPVS